jgi:hypothetical protein
LVVTRVAFCFAVLVAACAQFVHAAELTTGTIIGSVRTIEGRAVAGARVSARSPSDRYETTTDPAGRFIMVGVAADTYVVTAQAEGYKASADIVTVLPGEREQISFSLQQQLREIARVEAKGEAFSIGSTSDTFTVTGDAARASAPNESSSGLAAYTQGSVQGAIAQAPGVGFDSFANVIVRGGKVQDTVFDYDSVPIPQGLIAEPGGNIVGAQLGTTGVSATTLALGGYTDQSQNALGGVVNEIPAMGTYPARATFEIVDGLGARYGEVKISEQWATPDLRWRYALSSEQGDAYFAYGNGVSFYPAEIGTYGLALQSRAQSSWAGDVHFQPNPANDFSVVLLTGVATYDQYDTPYEGERWATFDSPTSSFPGEPADPYAQVTTPSRARGTYFLTKLQWLHLWRHAIGRAYVYRSEIGATANGPFWDDLSFPDGVISLFSQQNQRQDGVGYDFDDEAGKHDLRAGVQYGLNVSDLDEVVPTADELITSNPRLNQYLAYAGDTWALDDRFSATGTLRFIGQHVLTGTGLAYGVSAVDPHLGLAYTLPGESALRATFDHNSVAPLPLEVQRTDSSAPAPPVVLAPETADDYTLSYERGGPTQLRVTYYAQFEKNRIDVLPFNFRATSQTPDAVGVPTNAGLLRSHGLEAFVKHGGFVLNADYGRTFTSSVDQFAYNDLNPAAILAGHLYPAGYVPDFTATLGYEFDLVRRRVRITPLLSYESGYPYGNGTMVWILNPKTGAPVLVPNDNYVNPGYNYYFLKNPALPFNAASNPYIRSLGTNEGSDPNTLRSPVQTLVSVHFEWDVAPRVTAILDVINLLATDTPTQLQGNPYLIGPPGYLGGNVAYERAYGAQYCKACLYTLGNGVPTNNGTEQVVPWEYGTAGYVPQAYPLARTAQVRLRYRL